jgi:dTDP-4-amino-4,6-dideoxygalactose transaminase
LLLEGGIHPWAAALTAEGVPCTPGYLTAPLYAAPALREKVTYGGSGFPLQDVEYPVGLCPNAETLINERLVVLPWNENYSGSDVDDIVTAIRKVHTALALET